MSREAKALKKENNELEKQLSKETEDIQTDMVVYIRSANISELDQERVRRDIRRCSLTERLAAKAQPMSSEETIRHSATR